MQKDKLYLLESFARNSSSLASSFINKVRTTFLVGFLSAIWLGFYFSNLFGLSFFVWGGISLILGVPGIIIFKLWLLLMEIIELPEKLKGLKGSVSADDYKFDELKQKGFFKKLFKLGSLVKNLADLKDEAGEVASGFSGAFILGNPLFLTICGVISVFSWILLFISIITFLFYLF